MDAFSYLSVLLSIIIGLAITQLLQGFGRIIQARERVSFFWPPLALAGLFVVVSIQSWWAMFGLRDHTDWNFFSFLVVVAQTIVLYLTTAVILPEIPPGERVDLRAHYFSEVTWFFGLTIVMTCISLLKDVVFDGRLPGNANTLIQVGFIALAFSAIFFRQVWYHMVLVTVSLALFGLYIVLLFARLPGGG